MNIGVTACLGLAAALIAGCSGMPRGERGLKADGLAREMMAAVDTRAWEQTGAVRWTFAGRADHLWDRRRGFARVEWSDARVLIDLDRRIGRAFVDAREVEGEGARELLDAAHAKWTNDAFWLNPIAKIFDPGTEREVIRRRETGERGLLVRFTSGGRTPGDAYLFWIAGRGAPIRWQMWTSNLPVAGASATWEGWIQLKTGARISTKHETGLIAIELTGVEGAFTLAGLEQPDPFAELLACREGRARCEPF